MLSYSVMSLVLVVLVLLPLIGAGFVLAVANHGIVLVRRMALATVLAAFVLSVLVVMAYDPQKKSSAGDPDLLQMRTDAHWLALAQTVQGARDQGSIVQFRGPDIRFSLGVDGISLWLIALTALLMIPSVLVSWEAIQDRPASFYALMLVLESGLLGVFAAQDIILFYIFFEFTLVPLFFIIGLWGGYDRRWAARKFFIYTLAGSLLTFLGLVFIVLSHSWMSGSSQLTFSIPRLIREIPVLVADQAGANYKFWQIASPWIFAALFIGFAIKVPLFPFHTWLPLAHVEAPTAGSVLLAGVLLKLGSYGFLRFVLPLVPGACWLAVDFVAGLSVIGIIYGALLALAQDDIKKLVAYSSVSHMGFCLLGLFALNPVGISGSLLQMVNHGLSTGALFAMVGMLYERYHTRDIESYGGLTRKFPVLAFFFVLISLSSIGLPGLNGFTGELLSLMGMFAVDPYFGVLGLTGTIFGAWYMLGLVRRILYGGLREPALESSAHGSSGSHQPLPNVAAPAGAHLSAGHLQAGHGHGAEPHSATVGGHAISDLNFRELAALIPVAVMIVWIGVHPQFFLSRVEPSIAEVVKSLNAEKPKQVARVRNVSPADGRWFPAAGRPEISRGNSPNVSTDLAKD